MLLHSNKRWLALSDSESVIIVSCSLSKTTQCASLVCGIAQQLTVDK